MLDLRAGRQEKFSVYNFIQLNNENYQLICQFAIARLSAGSWRSVQLSILRQAQAGGMPS